MVSGPRWHVWWVLEDHPSLWSFSVLLHWECIAVFSQLDGACGVWMSPAFDSPNTSLTWKPRNFLGLIFWYILHQAWIFHPPRMICFSLWLHVLVDGRYLTMSENSVKTFVCKFKDWHFCWNRVLLFNKEKGREWGERLMVISNNCTPFLLV